MARNNKDSHQVILREHDIVIIRKKDGTDLARQEKDIRGRVKNSIRLFRLSLGMNVISYLAWMTSLFSATEHTGILFGFSLFLTLFNVLLAILINAGEESAHRLENELNIAHGNLENEIFEARKRLKEHNQILGESPLFHFEDHFKHHTKELNR